MALNLGPWGRGPRFTLRHANRLACTERIYCGCYHCIGDSSAYNRSLPCMEASYPYAIKNQPLVGDFGCLELCLYSNTMISTNQSTVSRQSRPMIDLHLAWFIFVVVQMMLLQHGGQHPLLLHHGSGCLRRFLLFLLSHRGFPLCSGICSSPTMFQVRERFI